ncbi:hypothetical protein CAOG_04396 [Capsaspora owczarzaki ATCC 30864]|uniref:Nuclear transport factor 2 n=1 Tax=Capsaspora owczarzaki (strain ATCC 30864) TaxID=595528 RepID=A0A0D2VRU9_CAPO3|nr:hypothetical protein CAOG_04396 [Capsaspora owczarzaki ATCC 30864]KJE93642.1 hypothetical protein CAOG_004396 [Capsaspora owczarzaki ATCC 30864]|eukprot:XP_004348224.1 hypothetical protein CAOG_04396 [Capsaspora owczarzaki ATCC 30864]
MSQAIHDAAVAGDSLVAEFYERYQTQRDNLVQLYSDSSSVMWNGNLYYGTEAIRGLLAQLPQCRFSIHSYDAQPITAAASGNIAVTMVSVAGYVQYANSSPKPFSHTFVIQIDVTSNALFIQSECMRFL